MIELALTETAAGHAVLPVRAAPGASRERIVGVHGGALKIAVAVPPERGKANGRIVAVLAKALGLPAPSITLLSGATSRDKRFVVEDVDAATLRQRLDALLS